MFRPVIASTLLCVIACGCFSEKPKQQADADTQPKGTSAALDVNKGLQATVSWPVTDQPGAAPDASSISDIADGRFVAGCRVNKAQLSQHPYFGMLPIDRILPGLLSLGKLEELGIEELVILGAPGRRQQTQDRSDGIEWVVSAKCAAPVDLANVLRLWRRSLVEQEPPAIEPAVIQIGAHNVRKIPAGTFIPAKRVLQKLSFTDRAGEPTERGINVGNIDATRSFVAARSMSSAVFRLEGVDETVLTGRGLELELFTEVFLTKYLHDEFATATIEIRNPDSGLVSQPITLQTKSSVWNSLIVPRKLRAVDDDRKCGLMTDFVSQGQLEIVIRSPDEDSYFGFAPFDLRRRSAESEFVNVDGNNIMVTQSAETLQALLDGKLTSTSTLWPNRSDADIEVVVHVDDRSNRRTFERICALFSEGNNMRSWSRSLQSMTLTVDVSTAPAVRLLADFSDSSVAKRVAASSELWLNKILVSFDGQLKARLGRLDTHTSLASMVFGGRIYCFPQRDSAHTSNRIPALTGILKDVQQNLDVKTVDNRIVLSLTQPHSLTNPSLLSQIAIANLAEVYALDLNDRGKVDFSDEVYRDAAGLFPDSLSLRLRQAWHLGYNVRHELSGHSNRYQCARSAISLLLDFAEKHPGNPDALYMLGRFVRDKIATTDDHVAMRPLFEKDVRLLRRFSELVDQTSGGDHANDGWSVAEQLFVMAVQNERRDALLSSVLVHAGPAALQETYAQTLTEAEQWGEAKSAWAKTEKMFLALGDRQIELRDGTVVRLSDFQPPPQNPPSEPWLGRYVSLEEFQREQLNLPQEPRAPNLPPRPTDPAEQRLQVLQGMIQFYKTLERSRFEQRDDVVKTRQLISRADSQRNNGDQEQAMENFDTALAQIGELRSDLPKPMIHLANEFLDWSISFQQAVE